MNEYWPENDKQYRQFGGQDIVDLKIFYETRK
jgi:hypothetical protein